MLHAGLQAQSTLPRAQRKAKSTETFKVCTGTFVSGHKNFIVYGSLKLCIFAVRYNSGVWRSPVSAPALGAGGRVFESHHPDFKGLLQETEEVLFFFTRTGL